MRRTFLLRVFSDLNQLGERGGIAHGQIGQHFAIDRHTGFLQAEHELAVRQAADAGGSIDARDPQFAEVAGAGASVAVRVIQRVQPRFTGFFPQAMARAFLTLAR